jgi:hypothetical protein
MSEGFEMLKRLEYIRQFFSGVQHMSAFRRMLKTAQERELREVVLCGTVLKTVRRINDNAPYLIATIADKTDQIEIFVNDIADMTAFEKAQKEQLPVMLEINIRFSKGSSMPRLNLRVMHFMLDLAHSLGDPVSIELKDGVCASNVIGRVGRLVEPFNAVTGFDADRRGIVVVLEKDIDRKKFKRYRIENLCVGRFAGAESRKAILDIIASDEGVERVMTEGKQHVPTAA